MTIRTRIIDYDEDGISYAGLLAWDDAARQPLPGVLVSHTIRGRTDFEGAKAEELAKLGYVAFALDVYGTALTGADDVKVRAAMTALLGDRRGLLKRLNLSHAILCAQSEVDARNTAAIGFCFGGLCVLDLARSGAELAAVVSFHGLFSAPDYSVDAPVKASVLALHGWDDPLVTPDSVVALGEEMTKLGVDWQVHAYGNTQHAFTNPAANDTERGTVYDATADRRSWIAMQNFLSEKLN